MKKICTKCKIKKELSEFCKDNSRKNKLSYICKECQAKRSKIYRLQNIKEKKIYDKKYYKKNTITIKKRKDEYKKNNKDKINKYGKKYRIGKTNYDVFVKQISYADKVRNVDGFLQVRCAYCGKWYFPTNQSIRDRISVLNGKQTGENRLYCSDECKEACPIYGQKLYPKGFKKYSSSREVQPELRQLVFERDNYTCLKCGKYQDELDVALHCHHIEGIKWNPLESADIDSCMTACKDCHEETHKQNDCGYHDLQCKEI